MSHRQERVSEQIHRTLSELITFESEDPRLAHVTISRVEVTGDLSRATIYILPNGNADDLQQAFEGLKHAQGYLRRQLARHLQLRLAPEIHFVLDEQAVRDEHLQQLLDDLEDQGSSSRSQGLT